MKNKTFPYFLTISPTICQINIVSLTFFPILKRFILLPYKTSKLLYYKLWPFKQNFLATTLFKVIQYGWETFQIVN